MLKYSSVALICLLLVARVQTLPVGRILRGWPALPDQFPYQVSVKLNGAHHCGGSIISKNYILTSAHCVVDRRNHYTKFPISSLSIQAGTTHRESGGIQNAVAETIIHPQYIYEGDSADIALVRLAKPLTFSKDIKAIELSSNDVLENTPVVISGWGRLQQDGAKPNQLQWTVLESLSQRSCTLETGLSPDKIFCLGHPINEGACTGDSGGPAVVDERLVGVASFILADCGSLLPDGYVQVSGYFDWIEEHSDV